MASCMVCRSRKVRCDGQVPKCRNCVRLGVSCPGYDTVPRREALRSTRDIFRAAGIEQRHVGSCETCRASKSKCSRTRPACRRCQTRRLECVYRSNKTSPSRQSPRTPLDAAILVAEDALSVDRALQKRLLDAYFDRIHPLGCLACIHKPSFMQSLDRQRDYGAPPLNAMCSLGARVLLSDSHVAPSGRAVSSLEDETLATYSDKWADRARQQVLAQMHVPTVQLLVALTLLCEYAFRRQQPALAFMLSGCLYRAIRLLDLDSDHAPTAATTVDQEVRSRIVWSSYIFDVIISSGVDKNSSWDPHVPSVALPWPERNFNLQIPPVRSYHLADLDGSEEELSNALGDLDLPSLSIILARLKSKVLKLIRTAPTAASPIWHSSSPFRRLNRQLQLLYDKLPDGFRISRLSIFAHAENKTAGAVFGVNLRLHTAFVDLNRIALEGFAFPYAAGFASAPPDFRLQCQEQCQYHAGRISDMLWQEEGQDAAAAYAFDDPSCYFSSAFESAKVQVVYMATVPAAARSPDTLASAARNVRTNIEAMSSLHRRLDAAAASTSTCEPICMIADLCDRFHLASVVVLPPELRDRATTSRQAPSRNNDNNREAEVVGPPSMHFLSASSVFRHAQRDIQREHRKNGRGHHHHHHQDAVTTRTSQIGPLRDLPAPSSPTSGVADGVIVGQGDRAYQEEEDVAVPAAMHTDTPPLPPLNPITPTTATRTTRRQQPPRQAAAATAQHGVLATADPPRAAPENGERQGNEWDSSASTTITAEGGEICWPLSIEDNIRTAHDMSGYLTMWDDSFLFMDMQQQAIGDGNGN